VPEKLQGEVEVTFDVGVNDLRGGENLLGLP
jgi:hypothetical protein